LSLKTNKELLRISWYNSLFDEDGGYQAGWVCPRIFREEKGIMVLNKGRFTQNLYLPPS